MKMSFKGYIPLPKRTLLYMKEGQMDLSDYGFFVFLIQIADWDKKHSTFGCINKTDAELSLLIKCNPSTISRRRKKLREIGLLSFVKELNKFKIKDFERYTMKIATKLSQRDVASLQEDDAQMHELIAGMQDENAVMQECEARSNRPFSVSYKENVSFSDELDIDEISIGIEKMKRDGDLQY